MKARPKLASLAFTGALAAALLVVPVTYERTVAHRVSLAVSGPDVDAETAGELAAALERELDGGDARVRKADASSEHVITARVPTPSAAEAGEPVREFASRLARRGLRAEVSLEPLTEPITGSVYAMAYDKLRLSFDEEASAEEIEEDIRVKLQEAGLVRSEVDVDKGDDYQSIQIRLDGEELDRLGRIEVDAPESGDPAVSALNTGFAETLDVTAVVRSAVEALPDDAGPEEIRAAIEDALDEAGIDGELTRRADGELHLDVLIEKGEADGGPE